MVMPKPIIILDVAVEVYIIYSLIGLLQSPSFSVLYICMQPHHSIYHSLVTSPCAIGFAGCPKDILVHNKMTGAQPPEEFRYLEL